ncbi:MAG: hypothetical protein J7M21_06305, partial [Planctomycetes bacterium]|nr:hypothetical protein [Planctomycetota bacterium]
AAAHLPRDPAGRTLVVRGTVIHYESASTLGFVIGPLEEVIVRAELVDKDTQRVLGRANCIGRTKASINAGPKQKAKGLAKAFVRWIDSRYPKDKKVK